MRSIKMYEYKVENFKFKEAESEMNKLAKEGWRVVSVTTNTDMTWAKDTIIVIFERNSNTG